MKELNPGQWGLRGPTESGDGAEGYLAWQRARHRDQGRRTAADQYQPPDTGERGREAMADGEFFEPADHAGSDVPSRFDISGYRSGLFGGPGADLFGETGVPMDRASGNRGGGRQGGFGRSGGGSGGGTGSWQRPPSASVWEPRVPVPHQPHQPPAEEDGTPMDPVTETGSLVRPYTRTGGRTRPDYDLAIEALVSTSDRGWEMEDALLSEHRSICDLCVETRSVAEVAAHLRLPLGVVRVLIGDMAGMGLVVIHSSGMVVGDRPSMDFLERVLSGLRRL
ncbi:MAG TPA: DUF742 domain-containing protein [Pseudonocardiaceae bacterium]|jgi:hypothetical protein|nr:DUF742 domain-containing protein [Pseudonocardiaceae bacterium]